MGRNNLNTKNILKLHIKIIIDGGEVNGGPRRIRTPDPLIRSQVLYPAELSVRVGSI